MTRIEKSTVIEAPIAQVFGYCGRIPLLPEWWANLVSVRNYAKEQAEKGLKYDWTYKMLGMNLDGSTEILDVVPNKRYLSKGTGGIPNTLEQTFEEAGPGKTRYKVTLEYTVPGSVLGKIADKLFIERFNDGQADNLVSALKAICEARAKAPAGA